MHTEVPLAADSRGLRIGVATSRYHHEVTGPLLEGACRAFREAGGSDDDLILVDAPGSFELVSIAQAGEFAMPEGTPVLIEYGARARVVPQNMAFGD